MNDVSGIGLFLVFQQDARRLGKVQIEPVRICSIKEIILTLCLRLWRGRIGCLVSDICNRNDVHLPFQFSVVVATGIISIQSVGHGATQRSQPVHSSLITVCSALVPPTMASTGQAWIHLVQPIHISSWMKATVFTLLSKSWAESSTSTPIKSASFSMVAWPPGGHLLILSPLAIASAYGRQHG